MAAVTWYGGQSQHRVTPATNAVNDIIDAMNTIVVANSASASAYWEVAEYVSGSPRSLMLKRKNNAAGRIVIFGQNGSTPNAAAVRGTATASTLYIGYSATSAVANVNSYLAGAPLAASDYMPGVACWSISVSSTYLLSYVEHTDGVVFCLALANSTPQFCGAGEILLSVAAADTSAIFGTGTTLVGAWPTTNTATGSIFPGTPAADNSYNSTQSAIVARISSANKLLYRIFTFNVPANQTHDLASHRAEFYPIWLCHNTTDTAAVFGKLKQIAFGPPSNRRAVRVGGGSPPNQADAYALGHQHFDLVTASPVWFTNFTV